MMEAVLKQTEKKGMMKSKIEIITSAVKFGILDNDIISKLVNFPLEEIIRIRKKSI